MLQNCKISGFADEINRDFDVQLQVLTELGQKYIELRSADGVGIADMTFEKAEECKRKLERSGIRVSALGSPIGKIQITDPFEPHFETYKHVVELAKLFETPYIRMFSFYLPENSGTEDHMKAYTEEVMRRMQQLVTYAEKEKVVLLHENEKGIYGEDAARCRELMDRFYGASYKCTFDFANFVQARQDTLEAYELLKPYIHYVHVKDALAENGEVVVAGEGDGHVREILQKLEDTGFDGYLSLEPHLFSFAGLSQLEHGGQKKKEDNGIAAYKKAYNGLIKICR